LIKLEDKQMLSDQELSEKADLSGDTFLNELWYAIRKNKMAMAGGIVIILLILIALFASYISPYDPYHVDLDMQLQKPSAEHWLGTDEFGRDLLTRIMFGTRISLAIGLIPTILSLFIGTILGMVSGYYGKRTDFIIMRIADVVLAFPELLLAMVIMYTLGANILNIFIALSLVRWARVARVVRAQTMSIKEKEYVEASRAIGVKNWIIMFRHILPNCLSSLIVLFTLDIPNAILSEASLSFLGIGAQPPAASWGLMISRGKEYLFSAPWVAISPGIAILLIVLAFNYLGDGLRDALDPYMKQ